MCANTPNLDLNFQVKSIKIPDGLRFRFYADSSYLGQKSTYFYEDVSCLIDPIGFSLLAAKLEFNDGNGKFKGKFLRGGLGGGHLLKKNRK